MAVNLTKPPRKHEYASTIPKDGVFSLTKPSVMREYTPVHLIDEEESILRNSRDVPERAIEVSVVRTAAENAPVMVRGNDLCICMDTLLDAIESADEGTQKKFANEFLKAAKKIRKALFRKKNALFVEVFLPAFRRGIVAIAGLSAFKFFPSIVEQTAMWLPTDEKASLLELVTTMRPLFTTLGGICALLFGLSLMGQVLSQLVQRSCGVSLQQIFRQLLQRP